MTSDKSSQDFRLNVTVKRVLGWFGESERCIMHKNVVDVPVQHINLSNDDINELIERGLARGRTQP